MNRLFKFLPIAILFVFSWIGHASAAEVDLYCWVNNGPPIHWAPCSATNPLQITGGGGGGGLSVTDQASWTNAVSAFTPTGGVFNDSATALSSGNQGTVRLNANREMHVTCDASNILCAAINSGVITTGSAVPATALYTGINVGGTGRGWTGVNPSGSIFAGQVDIASQGGASLPKGGVGVVSGGSTWNTIAASQTAQVLSSTQAGGTGAVGDYLSHCVIQPTSTSPGVVTVFDGTNTATNDVIAFPGGASSVSNLVPFPDPVGAVSVNSGGWKVTTGANVTVTCFGKFT